MPCPARACGDGEFGTAGVRAHRARGHPQSQPGGQSVTARRPRRGWEFLRQGAQRVGGPVVDPKDGQAGGLAAPVTGCALLSCAAGRIDGGRLHECPGSPALARIPAVPAMAPCTAGEMASPVPVIAMSTG